MIYIIGSLTNPRIPEVAALIRAQGYDVFDQWHAAGPEADKFWQAHFQEKGYSMRTALKEDFPQTALKFDMDHINQASCGVMVMPAGRSGHLELGRINGQGKPTFILYEKGEPEKWDLMYGMLTGIAYGLDDLLAMLEYHIGAYNSSREFEKPNFSSGEGGDDLGW